MSTPRPAGAPAADPLRQDWPETDLQAVPRCAEAPRHLVRFTPPSLRRALLDAGFERPTREASAREALFCLEQSEAMRAGRDPYAPETDASRAARRARRAQRGTAHAWDRRAAADPALAESITMLAWRPGA